MIILPMEDIQEYRHQGNSYKTENVFNRKEDGLERN